MPRDSLQQRGALAQIFAKEFLQLFRSPIAWLFLAAFLLVSLFVFFWVEAFFARNITDVRPLFEWLPILLVFLASALTMKMWSEERKSGTLEHVLTRPVPLWQFVIGKFLACWALLAVALVLTVPIPLIVSALGDLDFGPVWSGYIAALLLGGAYLAIGLFVSAQTENQIVSLIVATAVAGAFYLIGAPVVTQLFGNSGAEVLRSIGTGSRFEAIARGVLDLRDCYYYLSLIIGFLALNIFVLERGRWAAEGSRQYHLWVRAGTALLVVNVLFANVWLAQVGVLRVDTTQGNLYSVGEATRRYVTELQEPLLIRGYFSQKTHPLLAPLVPQMQDLLREYAVVGDGRIRVEIIDPTADPALEDEANNTYNIKPTPFRVNDRHQAALVNSYFDVLLKYGDEHKVLSFNDLIEVRATSIDDIDVQLRNPEYDVTRAIKNILYSYQSGGDIFAALDQPLQFTAYFSPEEQLPAELKTLRGAILKEAEAQAAAAGGNLSVEVVDPAANGGVEGQRITEQYGFQPMALTPLDPNTFYFYMTLGQGDQLMQVDAGDFSEAGFKASFNAALKRFGQGFTRTLALVTPAPEDSALARHMRQTMPRFDALKQLLSEDANVIDEDLSDGRIDPSADLLVLVAPEIQDEKGRFAIDQFLMRGGTVILASAPFRAEMGPDSMTLNGVDSGLNDWLAGFGISVPKQLVMDPQNTAFPVPTLRQVAGMSFQEMRMVDYPYFIDVRGEGLNQDLLMTRDLPQVTVPWAAPIVLDDNKLAGIEVTRLVQSSPESWLSDSMTIMPDAEQAARGYRATGERGQHLLGAMFQGRFNSSFAGKDSPLAVAPEGESPEAAALAPNQVLPHSAESARLILLSSSDIFRDEIVGMLGSAQGGAYLNSLQLAINAVDFSLEDEGLLSIRSRGHFNRTLAPMNADEQSFWEYLSYGAVLLLLALVWLALRLYSRAERRRQQQLLAAH